MKFEDEIETRIFEPWRQHYISYLPIKNSLRQQADQGWQASNEKAFESTLRVQAEHVLSFIDTQQTQIESQLSSYEHAVQTHTQPEHSEGAEPSTLASVKHGTLDIMNHLSELFKFTRLNFRIVKKLVRLHKKYTGLELMPYNDIMQAYPLDCQRFDLPLVRASRLLDICKANIDADGPVWVKFWIHKDNLNEVKALLDFYATPQRLVEGVNDIDKCNGSDTEESTVVSSIYLDTTHLDLYTKRLQRGANAEEIHLRWYGPAASDNIFLERRVFNPDPSLLEIKDDAVCLHAAAVDQILGTGAGRIMPAPKTIQADIYKKQLHSMFRMICHRRKYQASPDHPVTLHLDTNIAFIREVGPGWRRPQEEIDDLFQSMSCDDLHQFPYAVLRVHLPQHIAPYHITWLEELLDSNLLYEVPLYSTFQMGIVYAYKDQITLLPWWIHSLDMDIRNGKDPKCDNKSILAMDALRKPRISNCSMPGYLERLVTVQQLPERAAQIFNSSNRNQPSDGKKNSLTFQIPTKSTKPKADECIVNVTPSDTKHDAWTTSAKSSATVPPHNLHKRDLAPHSNPASIQSPSIKKKKKNPKIKLEPKVMLANERTFIHWLQFSGLIFAASLLLLNFGDRVSAIAGATFLCISMLLALYAGWRVMRRLRRIRYHPDERYDDLYGPIMLCTLFVGALILNATLRYIHGGTSTTYLGVNSTTDQQNSSQHP